MPALPLDDAGPYVAAAYLVFLGLILVYVAIMATRLARTEREIEEVARMVEARNGAEEREREEAPAEAPPLAAAGGEARRAKTE